MKDKENKLIALFMGLEEDGVDGYLVDMDKDYGYQIIHESCFLYNSSWDWLMPVVEKIENDGLDPHGMIDNSLRKNNQKRWRSIEDLHNVAVYLINIYNNGR
jgi:hypothetical protein|tara:strand:- start:793 stop:1098 length:306 start_codon:yes stop_codon:yes gene_type:complete